MSSFIANLIGRSHVPEAEHSTYVPPAPSGTGYEQHPRAQVNRLKKRGHYDFATVHNILDSVSVVHVAFPASTDPSAADPFPALLPMIGCTGDFAKYAADPASEYIDEAAVLAAGPRDVYLHGYVSARLFKTPTTSTASPGGGDDDAAEGVPVTICATQVTALKLALAPFHNSYNYRSANVFGYASVVTDPAERAYAFRRVTDGVVRGRWDGSRQPVAAAEDKSTGLIRVRVANASAKVNEGPAGPDERSDMKDGPLRARVWTGIIPVQEVLLAPVANADCQVAEVPEYVTEEVRRRNWEAEGTWRAAAAATPKK